MALHNAIQYSTVQYSTVQYSTVQYSVVWYCTVHYSTVYTVQHSRVHGIAGMIVDHLLTCSNNHDNHPGNDSVNQRAVEKQG